LWLILASTFGNQALNEYQILVNADDEIFSEQNISLPLVSPSIYYARNPNGKDIEAPTENYWRSTTLEFKEK
jgi:hypothetical protein